MITELGLDGAASEMSNSIRCCATDRFMACLLRFAHWLLVAWCPAYAALSATSCAQGMFCSNQAMLLFARQAIRLVCVPQLRFSYLSNCQLVSTSRRASACVPHAPHVPQPLQPVSIGTSDSPLPPPPATASSDTTAVLSTSQGCTPS